MLINVTQSKRADAASICAEQKAPLRSDPNVGDCRALPLVSARQRDRAGATRTATVIYNALEKLLFLDA